MADAEPDAFQPPPGACLPQSLALSPQNGHATAGTRRPFFRWTEARAATRYEIEVDDSCGAGFLTCTFDSPEVAESTTETWFSPAADLPVSESAPVGRRYFWRMRACQDDQCADWSEARYVDVGRSPKDFDGDGFADAAVGARSKDIGGKVFVYYGSASGLPGFPDQTLDNPDNQDGAGFGFSVAAADLNADGFGDLIVGAPSQDAGASNEGLAFVYYGSASGLPTVPDTALDNPDNEEMAFFGSSVADAGDLDGDGFADLAVGAPSRGGLGGSGGAFVYMGAAGGIADTPSVTLDHPEATPGGNFGTAVGSVGDFGGDGYADLVVGATGGGPDSPGEGVFVYCGSGVGIGNPPNVTLRESGDMELGAAVEGGDLNGDGLGDVVVGAPRANSVLVYMGASTGLEEVPGATLQRDGRFGKSLATGDVDGDGLDDLLVGADEANSGAAFEGAAHLYLGNESGPRSVPNHTLDNPANETNGHFGSSVAVVGDTDGDGTCEIIVGAPLQAGSGQVFLYHWGPTGLPVLPDRTLAEPDGEGGARFGYSVARAMPPFAPDACRLRPNGFGAGWLDWRI